MGDRTRRENGEAQKGDHSPCQGHAKAGGPQRDQQRHRMQRPKREGEQIGGILNDPSPANVRETRNCLFAFDRFQTHKCGEEPKDAEQKHTAQYARHCLNRKTALAMVFRLMMSAKKKWRKISGPNRLPEVIQGVVFKDGIKQLQAAA